MADLNGSRVGDEMDLANKTAGHPELYENAILNTLYVYVFPVFILVGLVGNCLTCFLVNRPPLRSYSISFYTFAYTVSNILTLFLNYVVLWLHDVLERKHFNTYSDSGCRIWEFVVRMITYSGIWFVVAMGIDRYIALWHPRKAPDMCNVFMSKIAVVLIMTAMLVLSVHAMWTYELDSGYCLAKEEPTQVVWLWVSGMSYSALPLVIMFILANLLIVRICLKHRGRQLPESALTEMDLTYTVVVLCYVYFLLLTPATVINIVDYVRRASATHGTSPKMNPELEAARTIANLVSWVNHTCLLFLAWFSCSRAFRKTLRETIAQCRACRSKSARSVELKMLADDNEVIEHINTAF